MASPTPAEVEAMLPKAFELCPLDTFQHHCAPIQCWSCDRIATALATVAAEEREACAVACDKRAEFWDTQIVRPARSAEAALCAAEIRARSSRP